jgi:hypothetical protein
MEKAKFYVVYWFGTPVFQSTDELCANAYANTYNTAIVKVSNKSIINN